MVDRWWRRVAIRGAYRANRGCPWQLGVPVAARGAPWLLGSKLGSALIENYS